MKKGVYISDKLYNLINTIGEINDNEQMMVFGGKTVGNTIIINEKSFIHFGKEKVKRSDDSSITVALKELVQQMIVNKELGNDTFFMAHSHPQNIQFIEFMYADLSDDDEVISKRLRQLCSKFGLSYYDGITTGKKLYFWSTINENNPRLMNCYVDGIPVDYNNFTQISETIEHLFR